MKYNIIGLVTFFFCILSVGAQTKHTSISGKVIDGTTKTSVEQAAVRIVSLPDSAFVTGVSTNKNGTFSVSNLKKGHYALKVSFIGYNTLTKSFQISSTALSVNIGTLTLGTNSVMLKSAVIVGEAPPVVVVADTLMYNASAYRVPEGAMLEELVKKLPGVEVSTEGKITLNGKEIKKIMVDGKEFFTKDPKVSMKNLPVNMIDKVKAYDKKSDLARITGVDDGDDEAVLDLSVKKDMKKGLVGNGFVGYGNKDLYDAGIMVSRFKDDSQFSLIGGANNTNNQGFSELGDAGSGMSGNAGTGVNTSKSIGADFSKSTPKLDVGGDVKFGNSDRDARMKSYSETLFKGSSSYASNDNASRRNRNDFNADVRLEWKPDTLTNIIFRPGVTYSHTNSSSEGTSENFDSNHAGVNKAQSNSNNILNSLSTTGNLQINRKLNSKGRNITFRADYGYNNNESDKYAYSNTFFFRNDSTSIRDQYVDNTGHGYNYRLQAVYMEPIFTNRFLQLKYSYQYQFSSSEKYTHDRDASGGYKQAYVDSLSNSFENRYTTQQFDVSMRTIRPKYMYSIGMTLEPQSSTSKTLVGPNKGKDISQKVLNYSPNFDLRYRFSKQEMLRITYRGKSNAPNVDNLQAVIDQTDPLNIKYGNPDLKPSYDNRFMVFYNNYLQKSQRSVMVNVSLNNTINSVASKMSYNSKTGGRITNLVNVNGNWNANGFFAFNTPLWSKKFTVNTFTNASYGDVVSFATLSKDAVVSDAVAEKGTTHNLMLSQRLSLNYRNDLFDVGLNGGVNYALAKSSVQVQSNRETFDYTFGANTNVNLPWDVSVSSDATYAIMSGYSGGFDKHQLLWNGQLSKSFLSSKRATLRFSIYDILRQQSNLTRTVTASMIQDTEYNTLGSYFMVHFVYKLNTLGGKTGKSNRRPGEGGRYRDHSGSSHGGRGRM